MHYKFFMDMHTHIHIKEIKNIKLFANAPLYPLKVPLDVPLYHRASVSNVKES